MLLISRFFLLLTLLIFGATLPLQANPAKLGNVQEITLSNGMKFLLLHRDGAPVFSAYLAVKVGGVDERDGQTGIAHLLEHMAFKGTSDIGSKDYAKEKILLGQIEQAQQAWLGAGAAEKPTRLNQLRTLQQQAGQLVEKEEFSKIYLRNGATNLNATTSQDLTSYFVTLPSEKFELWAFLESQRLSDPVFREFYSEKDVVLEERRMRVEDSPFGRLYEAFIQNAFVKSPYRRPTIGYPADIEKLSATDLKRFYDIYYSPQNMVGSVVGNFPEADVRGVLEKTFGKLARKPLPKSDFPVEPEPTAPRQTTITMAASPAIIFGYLKPTMPHPDDYTFDVLEQILCEGRTSRLYRRLVEQDQLAQNVSCSPGIPGSRLPNLFFVYVTLLAGKNPEAAAASFEQELQKLRNEAVPAAELEKAKKNLLSDWYFEMQSNEDMAQTLSYFEALAGSWKYVLQHAEKIGAVQDKAIKNILQKYLTPEKRRSAVLNPSGAPR